MIQSIIYWIRCDKLNWPEASKHTVFFVKSVYSTRISMRRSGTKVSIHRDSADTEAPCDHTFIPIYKSLLRYLIESQLNPFTLGE